MSDIQMSDVDSLLSHTPPKAKKAAAPKRAGSKPLADVENESSEETLLLMARARVEMHQRSTRK